MSGRIVPIGLIDRSPWADESREWCEDGFDLGAHVAWLTGDIEARGMVGVIVSTYNSGIRAEKRLDEPGP